MRIRPTRLILSLAGVALVAGASGWTLSAPREVTAAAAALDSTLRRNFNWRSIGPDRGGRSIAASGVRGRPNEAYFGATGGGLWKTTNGGTDWTPVTDGHITSASVGAVAVSESNPDIVYIGTGETCIRGNIMAGDGVYKSTDAGRTWSHIGFREAQNISKIRVHPTDPNIVYVAAFGKFGVPNAERGVFKSTDGGRSWRKVLFRNDETGAIDISIDPSNPNVIYAALWEAFRKEYQMSSGGPGSGLFKSTDGGETWTEITRARGLPAGMIGRIGVSVSGANPNRVWALVENDNGGLFRSEDGGASWSLINGDRRIRQRAFYYTHVTADPRNADVVYLLNTSAFRSTDGGRTITSLGGGTHGDFHDLWINPDNPQHLVIANDGGGAISTAGGEGWSAQDFPTPQYYGVTTTRHQPYQVCGSQQDGQSVCLSSTATSNGGGRTGGAGAAGPGGRGGGGGGGGRGGGEPVMYNVGGSENGYMAQDPKDLDVFYVGTNANGGGFLNRTNRRTGHVREVSPYPRMFSGEESAVIKERWQWTYPILFSPVDPNVLYTSSQRLWKTTNGGQTWTAISGDLTRHDPRTMGPSGGPITRDMNGPEVYATIFAVGPSKRDVNVIWTGSDDGLVHVTRDGGTTWSNVTPKDMPEFGRVSLIDASAFNTGTAYVAVKRPLLGDMAPYIFRTTDFGRSWTRIVNGIRGDDYVHAVREDPTRRGLLYAGTQHGVYISYDDGAKWESLSLNLPDVPVSSMIVEDNDLVISTMGRGFYILDDIAPIRQYSPTVSSAAAHLFAPAPAIRSGGGATVQYLLRRPAQQIRLEMLDSAGRVIQTLNAPAAGRAGGPGAGGGVGGRGGGGGMPVPPLTAGLHSIPWDLRYPGATTFPGMILWGGNTNGPLAAPGTYRVRMTVDGQTQTQSFVVRRNPLFTEVTDADLRAQHALAIRIRDKVSEANQAVIDIRRMRDSVQARVAANSDARLATAANRLLAGLAAVEGEIYQVKNQAGQDPLNFPIKVNNRLASLNGVVNRGDGRPIGNAEVIFRDLVGELKLLSDQLARVVSGELAAFNVEARRVGLAPVASGR